ncbi:MAG: T9SS type A sorting domain-containing protein [Paludibacter sp.]|nr:T9SS type A sorting domain-containing protein [Paludibacter sp.]
MRKITLFKACVILCMLVMSTGMLNAQLTVTASGLPNIGRGQIKFADFNNDGKLDALVVGQTAAFATSGCIINFYTGNGDGTFTDATATWLTPATPTAVNSGMIGVADYDKDGKLDFCYAGRTTAGANVVYLYRNTGSTFTNNTTAAFTGTTAPTGCYFGSIEWSDVDNDGDLDLLIHGRTYTSLAYPGSSGARTTITQLYKNNNNGTFTSSAIPTNAAAYGQTLMADLDLDGDPDYLFYGGGNIGGQGINDGTGTFTNTSYSGTTNTPRASNMVYGDFNKDGKIDYIQSYINSSGTPAPAIKLSINTTTVAGTYANTSTAPGSITPLGSNGTYVSSGIVSAVDYDNDGDLDLSIHGLATATPTTVLYLNNGETTTPTFISAGLTLTGLQYGGEVWADLNGDNKPDLITFGYSDAAASTPATIVYLNGTATANTAPSAPSTITAIPSGSVASISWTMPASADDHTPNVSLTYNVRIGTTSGSSNILTSSIYGPGKYNLTSANVKGLADGTYYWSVQAVDAAYVSGTWATEGTFTIGSPTTTPSAQAINLSATTATQTSITMGWTNGDGYKTAVFMKEGTNLGDYPAPSANTAYSPNTVFGNSGSQIGSSGWYCVYNGPVTPLSAGSVVVTGLTGKRDFQVMVISYNGTADNTIINYLTTTSTNNPVILSSLDYVVPTSAVTSGLTVATNFPTTTTVSIKPSQSGTTPNVGYATVVFIKEGSDALEDVSVASNTTYTGNTVFGSGTQVETSGWYCVYNGNSSYLSNGNFNPFSTFTGLKYNTSYQVRACTYNGIPGLEKYSARAGVTFATLASTTTTFNTEGNWSTYGNWSAGLPGTLTTDIIINNNCTKDGDLTIEQGVKYTLNSSYGLTVNGNLAINSNATGTATFVDANTTSGLTVSGTTTVQQYLTSGRNWYVSSPVATATTSALSSANTINYYNEPAAAFVQFSTESSLLPLKGYISAGTVTTGNVAFSGALNSGEETVTLPRTYGVTKSGFNLVGNPYPSYVSWDAAEKSNLETTMWYRSMNSGATAYVFDTYNATGQIGTGLNGETVNSNIPPMQAFWVRVKPAVLANDTTGTLTFRNSMRSHKGASDLKLKSRAVADATQQVLRLQVSNGTNIDEAVVYFNPNASDGLDDYDSPKMSNANAAIPEIYTIAGTEKLVINGLSVVTPEETLPLGFTTGQSNSFSIKATQIANFDGMKVYLRDNVLNTEQELTDASSYTFTSDVASTTTRFSVVFKAAGVTTGINASTDQAVVINKNANNQITVNCKGAINDSFVSVYNALGQKVSAQQITASNTIISSSFRPGVYVVTVNNGNKTTTKKVILN